MGNSEDFMRLMGEEMDDLVREDMNNKGWKKPSDPDETLQAYREAFGIDRDRKDEKDYGFGIGYYTPEVRTTLDGLWEEADLVDVVKDEVYKLEKEFNQKYKGRAVRDKRLLNDEFVSDVIVEGMDLVELYNTLVDKHRDSDLFGITHFQNNIHDEVLKVLKKNLITG